MHEEPKKPSTAFRNPLDKLVGLSSVYCRGVELEDNNHNGHFSSQEGQVSAQQSYCLIGLQIMTPHTYLQ